ncbi:hypothetical protein QLR68_11100 [Micromonospora sp. DH15]|nr:hypothetical protein [Micromonospora sp. DH15]
MVKALLVLAFVAPPVVIGMLRKRRRAGEPATTTPATDPAVSKQDAMEGSLA